MNGQALALITGAAGDIGRATAALLAERGWSLALVDHPGAAEVLTGFVEELSAAGATAWSTTFDVTDAAATADGVDRCVVECGTPTALFNNAGVQGAFTPIDRYPLDDAAATIAVNLTGAIHVLTATTAAMVALGDGGSVVCTASMAGVSGAPNMAVYSATKAAIIGLVKSAAKDLAPHRIRVNAVSPAFIGPGRMWDTQVAAQAAAGSQYYPADSAAVAAQMIGQIPLRRYGSLAEVATAVAFLLSPDSSYVTGVNLEVNGGAA